MLAIIGTSSKGWRGAARFGKFSEFQKHVGELGLPDGGDFLGGHAACHALMNGVARVAYAAVQNPLNVEEIVGAFSALRAHGPFDALVIPGVRTPVQAQLLVQAWERERKQNPSLWGEAGLWLDAPDDLNPQTVLDFVRAAGLDGEYTHAVGPHIPTQSPGCWKMTRLPGSCVLGALLLGTARQLRGAHEPNTKQIDPGTLAEFSRAGAAWLYPTGARALVGLQVPGPLHIAATPKALTLEDRIRAALQEATEATVSQGLPQGPKLWKQLERRATATLAEFRTSGEISQFALRCDAETNDDSAEPVIAVWYKTPQRVQQLSLRIQNLSR